MLNKSGSSTIKSGQKTATAITTTNTRGSIIRDYQKDSTAIATSKEIICNSPKRYRRPSQNLFRSLL